MRKTSLVVITLVLTVSGLRAEQPSETPAASPELTPSTAESASSATDAPVIQAEDTASMESKVGSEVIIEGTVARVGKGPNDGITFLNFGERRSGFVAVVFRASYDKFPEGFEKYSQQRVRVRGTLEKYRDQQLQIRISTPDQLEIVASDAP